MRLMSKKEQKKKIMNKKKLFLAGLLLLLVTSVNAQSLWDRITGVFSSTTTIDASDNIVSKTIDLAAFDALSKSGSIDVVYVQEPGTTRPRVEITGPDNIVELVVVEQTGSNVKVHYKPNVNFRLNKKPFKVVAYSSDIRKLSTSGSGDLDFGNIQTGDFTLSLSGSGDIEGGSIRSTGDVSVSLGGSGDIELKQVQCFDLKVSIAGSGDVEVKGVNSENVDARIAGSGDISLAGQTKKAAYGIAGSGDIDARGLKAEEVSKRKAGSGSIEY